VSASTAAASIAAASTAATPAQVSLDASSRRAALLGTLAFLALSGAALAWAKWLPYLHKLHVTDATGAYPGKDVLAKAGAAGAGPSPSGAVAFLHAYAVAVWPALLAALVMAAAIDAFLPRGWLLGALGREGLRGRVSGGLAALPSMMCTCCSAPVVRTLRRRGVPTETALAYWLGNPLLNPAVLAFLAIVLPWQWVTTRVLLSALLVFGLSGLLARLADSPGPSPQGAVAPSPPASSPARSAPGDRQGAVAPPFSRGASPATRFGKALLANGAVIVPEYALVVLLVGLLRGWLLPVGAATVHLAALVTVLAALAGTLVVIPTGGEIPLLAALAAVGVGKGPLGALLIALPAISLPSMAMVGRTIGWRVTIGAALAVAAAAVLAGALLWALGS
jgi:uncharacterized protein